MAHMTEEELVAAVQSKAEEVNKLLEEAYLIGLKAEISPGSKFMAGGKGRGPGYRTDRHLGYHALTLQITFKK